MKVIARVLIVLIGIASGTSATNAQCRITKPQIKEIIQASQDTMPLTGLWNLRCYSSLYDHDTLVGTDYNDNQGSWYLIPDGNTYTVCHNENQEFENYEAKFIPTSDTSLVFSTKFSTGEVAHAEVFYQEEVIEETKKTKRSMAYSFVAPPELSSAMGIEESQKVRWIFEMISEDIDSFYYVSEQQKDRWHEVLLEEEQDTAFMELRTFYFDNNAKSEYAIFMRAQHDSGELAKAIGAEVLRQLPADDRFLLVSIRDNFPGIARLRLIFEHNKDVVYEIDVTLDQQQHPISISSVKISEFFSTSSARHIATSDYSTGCWR